MHFGRDALTAAFELTSRSKLNLVSSPPTWARVGIFYVSAGKLIAQRNHHHFGRPGELALDSRVRVAAFETALSPIPTRTRPSP